MSNYRKGLMFFIIALLFFALLLGCQGLRKTLIDLSESDVKNIEAVNEAALNILETWPTYSGMIQGALKNQWEQLPLSVIEAINELDAIACNFKPDKYPEGVCDSQGVTPPDFVLGYSVGLRILMLSEIVSKALEQFAPDLLKYVPALLFGGDLYESINTQRAQKDRSRQSQA